MAQEALGRVFSSGDAGTLYVSIPSAVAIDSAFPFTDGETVRVYIEDGRVSISPTDGDTEKEGRSYREPTVRPVE